MNASALQTSIARRPNALSLEAKKTPQRQNTSRHIPSSKRPLFSGHRLRFDHAVMPEKAALFYFLSALCVRSSAAPGTRSRGQPTLHWPVQSAYR